jgi:hypothetical protein
MCNAETKSQLAQLLTQFLLLSIFVYMPIMNFLIGTRQIAFPHFVIPVLPFFVFLIASQEIKKLKQFTRLLQPLQLKLQASLTRTFSPVEE